jgi:hypothetical protein
MAEPCFQHEVRMRGSVADLHDQGKVCMKIGTSVGGLCSRSQGNSAPADNGVP